LTLRWQNQFFCPRQITSLISTWVSKSCATFLKSPFARLFPKSAPTVVLHSWIPRLRVFFQKAGPAVVLHFWNPRSGDCEGIVKSCPSFIMVVFRLQLSREFRILDLACQGWQTNCAKECAKSGKMAPQKFLSGTRFSGFFLA
jgi:hypothetical protein